MLSNTRSGQRSEINNVLHMSEFKRIGRYLFHRHYSVEELTAGLQWSG